MASGHDLDSGATGVPELRKKRVQLGLGKLVAARVRNDRDSAACADPAHGVSESGPLVRDEAGPAFHEVAPEHALYIRRTARFHQMAREMRTADEVGVLGVSLRPREAAGDPGGFERLAHFLRPRCAAFPDRFEPGPQYRVFRIDLQADDVNR